MGSPMELLHLTLNGMTLKSQTQGHPDLAALYVVKEPT